MNRAVIVARTEFLALIRTKTFVIGVLLAPVMVGLSIGFQVLTEGRADVPERSLAVLDRTGRLYDAISRAATDHNTRTREGHGEAEPQFMVSRVDAAAGDVGALKVELSDRVRNKTLFAFIDIPPHILDGRASGDERIGYYSGAPSSTTLRVWLEDVLGREIVARRIESAGVETRLIADLTRGADVVTFGLLERLPDGRVREAPRASSLQTFLLPYLLFLALMTAAPQLLTAVIEEKLGHISEVLISSISPFQLMMGKLIGSGAVSVVLALVYFAGAAYAAFMTGQWDFIQPALAGWFVVFLVCAVLIFGAMFVAIGAACSDIKDSQNMMQPALLFILLPMIASPIVFRAPDSTLAAVVSLVPTASPFLMLLRLTLTPSPPLWQVLLSVVLTASTAVLFVWAAARIFRVGLLMQGKPPNLPELLRWIRE